MKLICIECPNGCHLDVSVENGVYSVSGNSCRRGYDFALAELQCPMRTLTSTVRTSFSGAPVLPVRTDRPIKKSDIPAVLAALRVCTVGRRVAIGETVLENAAGSGASIIASSDILMEVEN